MKTPIPLRRLLPAIAGLAALGSGFAFAGGADAYIAGEALPFRCGVHAQPQSGMTALQAVLESDTRLEGSYRLAVTSSSNGGRSQVNQGGPFVLDANQSVTLGTVSIGAGARADIVFELVIGGTTYTCASPAMA